MIIKQLTVFVENRVGYLSEITKLLSDNGIDMKALSIADTKDFGILRLIVDNPDKALSVLKSNDIIGKITEVIGVEIPNRTGELSNALSYLSDEGINVEYLYAFLSGTPDAAYVVIKATDNAAAENILGKKGYCKIKELN